MTEQELLLRLDALGVAIQRAAVLKRRMEVAIGFLVVLAVTGWLR